jgi:hypothetical protein
MKKMETDAEVVEDAWHRSFRDFTPSDAELSDYDPEFVATANLDISGRYDPTEFTRTPFTITEGRSKAKSKGKPPAPILQATPHTIGKKEEKKGKSKSKRPDNDKEDAQDTEDLIDDFEDTKEYTEDSTKKKKEKKPKFGGYSSYAEWDAAEERADRAGGSPIIPAAIQLAPTKKDEKKRYPNQRSQATGWLEESATS